MTGTGEAAAGAPRRLRDLVAERARALSEQAAGGADVPAAEVEALGRLLRLAEIAEAAAPPAPVPPAGRRRWPVIVLAVATLAVASALLFVPMRETEIALDATVSDLGFTLAAPRVLADGMQVATLGASGLRAIRLPATPGGRSPEDAEVTAVRLSVARRPGSITLARLALAPETRIWIAATAAGQYRLSLRGLAQPLRVDVDGPVQVAGGGLPATILALSSPAPVLLHPGSGPLDLDLEFPGAAPAAFLPDLVVRDLSLFRVDGFMDPQSPGPRRVSTLLGGTLYLESLNGAQRALRRRESLRFEDAHGEIQALRLDGDRVVVDFRGRVRGMTTGPDGSRRSLMPTVLEWLRARQGLALLWGTFLYSLGVVLAVHRWWRSPT
jgi:hypothetical protein